MAQNTFANAVLKWFDQYGRKNLPWQKPISAYRVWLSEVMLQQTQVDTVIPYFKKFVSTHTTIKSLANADLDNILHHWTGLGYYARARNLHKCAKMVTEDFKGKFPQDRHTLESLPGIGRSTAAAIASIAFEQPEAILDGNVKRVLARHHAIEGWPGNKQVENQLWEIAEQHMPTSRCRDYTQAMMDLGATLCTRSKPNCLECPIQSTCKGYKLGTPTDFPSKKPKKDIPTRHTHMLMVKNDSSILLEQRPTQGIWGGLWSFTEFNNEQAIKSHCLKHYPEFESLQLWSPVTHIFSHFKLVITPVLVDLPEDKLMATKQILEQDKQVWYNLHQPQSLGLAAPVKLLLDRIAASQLKLGS